jgi:hypothetical protein
MQAMNIRDILIDYNIIIYMGQWWNVFDNVFQQLVTKTMDKYGGCWQGNSPGHQSNHMVFIRWKMHQIKYIQYV